MVEYEFVEQLNEYFEDIDNAYLRCEDIIQPVMELEKLCEKYLEARVDINNSNLDGSD